MDELDVRIAKLAVKIDKLGTKLKVNIRQDTANTTASVKKDDANTTSFLNNKTNTANNLDNKFRSLPKKTGEVFLTLSNKSLVFNQKHQSLSLKNPRNRSIY